MPKFLVKASYTQEGLKGLLKEGGSSRKATIDHLISGLGGTMDGFYYAYGDADVYVIADVPDDATMMAVSLAVGASGSVTLSTTVLVDPETVDEAAKRTVGYRPPGA